MNAEQKQQAKQLIADWTNVSKTSTPAVWFLNGDCMAGFLQELVDAHEQKPVAYATGYYAGCLSIATIDGSVLPAGTALYAAPPHQSEHHLEMVNTPAPSVPGVANTFKRRAEEIVAMAMNRDNYAETNRLSAALIMDIANAAAAPTPAEAPADLDAPEFSDGCEKEGFPGGCARMGCCKQLPATANPARTGSSQIEPPADLVRDAERWLSEHDLELLVTFGMQADDCDADGHTLSKEQTRRLCELGVLRNVGFGRHEMTAFGDSIFGVHFSQGISLPLQTHAEYNAAIERNKQKGGEA